MGIIASLSVDHKKYIIFLNIFSLFVASIFFFIKFQSSSEFLILTSSNPSNEEIIQQDCNGFQSLYGYKAKCMYLKSHEPCVSQGLIHYLALFYCNFGAFPLLGYTLLFLWLLVLFYVLGNTASEYFCSSLENLSRILKLSPTIAGVTLLSFGNGAPDVFASLVSVMGTAGTREIGLNTVVGGASFVSCVVVGIISILVRKKQIQIIKSDFFRDVCFFLLVMVFLTAILINGEINVWGAVGFSSMYIVYVFVVYISHTHLRNIGKESGGGVANSYENTDLSIPILSGMEKGNLNFSEEVDVEEDEARTQVKNGCFCLRSSASCLMFLWVLEMPLYLPRRLTIPVVCEKKWSKGYAVASVTLAPLLLAALWSPTTLLVVVYGAGLFFGVTLGVLAYFTTENSSPPHKFLPPWLAGGFIMSVIWSYITAQELVGLLVSIGYVFGISPTILGLTVLAWGNSLGDLITNVTMALNGGAEGAQVAISGCYAGPIFNTLFGLGLSLVGSSWSVGYPTPLVIAKDPYLLETMGFLVSGLIWALVVLPRREMRVDGVLGGGLVVIYFISVFLRLTQTFGFLDFSTYGH